MRREDVGEIFHHNGYPMRSHSETRWASMMDCMGIRWIYEPRLFKTSLGMYLPDFYLPDMDAYLEVKGAAPSEQEIQKASDVQDQTGCPVIFGHGKPRMEGLHLSGGKLSSWIGGKPIHVTLYELSQGLEKYSGIHACARLANAGRIQQAPSCVSIGYAVNEYLRSFIPKSEEEKDRAKENKELNAKKQPVVGPITGPQFMVLNVICWLRSKINKEARQ